MLPRGLTLVDVNDPEPLEATGRGLKISKPVKL